MQLVKICRNFQITLPKIFRNKFNLEPGEYVELEINNDRIIIKPLSSFLAKNFDPSLLLENEEIRNELLRYVRNQAEHEKFKISKI